MGTDVLSVIIAAAALLFATVFNLVSSSRASKTDIKQEASKETAMMTKLETIGEGITEIKTELRSVRGDVMSNRERIVAVEQSAKQAHKRLDAIEQRKEKD